MAAFEFSLSIQVEPWKVMVAVSKKLGARAGHRPYVLLSEGEQLWTGLAFQIALAKMSGLGFCALDATEKVVAGKFNERQMLTDLIFEAEIGQVVVVMAKGVKDKDPEMEGLQVIRCG